jgi:hypothetical protein
MGHFDKLSARELGEKGEMVKRRWQRENRS